MREGDSAVSMICLTKNIFKLPFSGLSLHCVKLCHCREWPTEFDRASLNINQVCHCWECSPEFDRVGLHID